VHCFRQAKVQYLNTAFSRHHYIGRFKIAVNDAFLVRCNKRIHQWDRKIKQTVQREPIRSDNAGECAAINKFHGEEADIIFIFNRI